MQCSGASMGRLGFAAVGQHATRKTGSQFDPIHYQFNAIHYAHSWKVLVRFAFLTFRAVIGTYSSIYARGTIYNVSLLGLQVSIMIFLVFRL